jgi:formiminoglutamase
MSVLPILLSIPHGGSRVPKELRHRVCITPQDLFVDGDACTSDIFDLGDDVQRVIKTDVARAFVDLNRPPDERPLHHPDGVVKTATCFQQPIFKPGHEPGSELTGLLIERYHAPYHARLKEATAEPGVRLALDCHSMLPSAPPVENNRGEPRPLFCLSNRDGATAPPALLGELAASIASAFEVQSERIGLNDPFKGGYIIKRHGGSRLPWIQVEMNRCLYLEKPWYDRETLRVDAGRISELRECFRDALQCLRL